MAYRASDLTIRSWLEQDVESSTAEIREISRLRLEKGAFVTIDCRTAGVGSRAWEISVVEVTNKSALASLLN